ncbi:uncharacterized protein PAC_19128 [Phialocephala subalpina]|uniref:Uncharacterized protein n=1 Tax=Phialocephala subalpina TaxID=576137 RepID=A0A1L7XW44_9HELO|nr:uncharacterized protein PAC_19128 [Phialocephala subalpina]
MHFAPLEDATRYPTLRAGRQEPQGITANQTIDSWFVILYGMKHIAALQLFYHGRLTVTDIDNMLLKQIWMLQRPKRLHVDINDNPPPFDTPEERKEYYASILNEYPTLEPSFLHKAAPGLDLPYIYTTANRMEPEIRQLRNDMKAIARARILSYLDLIFSAGLDRDGTLESLKSPANVAWIREQLKIAFDKTHLHMFVVQLEQWPLSTNAEKKNLDSPWKRFSDGIVGGVEVKRNMFGRL